MFGYVAGICVLTGVLFGLAPALQISRTNVNDVLKDAGRGSVGTRRARWFTGSMVVVELALTIVLLAGAGLMLRSFTKLYALDVGFPTEHLMAMQLQLPDSKYATPRGDVLPGEDPIGKRLRFSQLQPGPGRPEDVWRTIVGISRSIPHGQRQQYEPTPVVYLPSRQDPPSARRCWSGARCLRRR